jgi:thiamine pyrophosphokinase
LSDPADLLYCGEEEIMSKKILIVANGAPLDPVRARQIASRIDIIIAADGGARYCQETNIVPDYILGDFDSIPDNTKNTFPHAQLLHRPHQDFTDLQKALDFVMEMNPQKILVINSQGSRTDHAAVNLLIFQAFSQPQILEIYDDHGFMKILKPGDHFFKCQPDQTISLFSLQPISNLSLEGFLFTVREESFTPFFLGISNKTVAEEFSLHFTKGNLFIYWLNP